MIGLVCQGGLNRRRHTDSMTATDEIVWSVSSVKQLACDRLSNKSRMISLEGLVAPTGWCAGGAVVVQCEIGLNMFVTFFAC